MKITTPFFTDIIELSENEVFSLVIEHRPTFLKLLKDIYYQIQGNEGDVVLSENNSEIKISKKIELITSFVPFDLNEKRLINKINSLLEKESLTELFYPTTMHILAEIERHIVDLSELMPFSVSCQNLTASAMIKMCGVFIDDDCVSDIERVLYYMSVVNDLLGEKIFVMVNMTMFFSSQEMQGYIDTCNLRKYRVLLIDGIESVHFSGTKRLIVDQDLCTI